MGINKIKSLDLNKPEWEGILRISADCFEIDGTEAMTVSITLICVDKFPVLICLATLCFTKTTLFLDIKGIEDDMSHSDMFEKYDKEFGEEVSAIIEDAFFHIKAEVRRHFRPKESKIILFPKNIT